MIIKTLDFDIGYNASAVEAMLDGVITSYTLTNEREQFIALLELWLNKLPLRFSVKVEKLTFSQVRATVATNYPKTSKKIMLQWLEDYYDLPENADDATVEAVYKKVEEEVQEVLNEMKELLICYGNHSESNLLIRINK